MCVYVYVITVKAKKAKPRSAEALTLGYGWRVDILTEISQSLAVALINYKT